MSSTATPASTAIVAARASDLGGDEGEQRSIALPAVHQVLDDAGEADLVGPGGLEQAPLHVVEPLPDPVDRHQSFERRDVHRGGNGTWAPRGPHRSPSTVVESRRRLEAVPIKPRNLRAD
jgi:hypothetical protein